MWVAEERYLTVNEVLDEYRDDELEDIKILEEIRQIDNLDKLSDFNSEIEWLTMMLKKVQELNCNCRMEVYKRN